MSKKTKINSKNGIKKYKITGKNYQSINTTFNGKMFYTPKKGQSITVECIKIPDNIQTLADNNILTIKELL